MFYKKLFGLIPLECFNKFCFDEMTGLIAIILGIIGYVFQFKFSEESLNLTSFSIVALFLTAFGEFFFMVQGIQKRSLTITFTRMVTCLAFTSFVILWFISKKKKNKKLNLQDTKLNTSII
jgi:Ca2+/Na+ antiporter